MPLTKQYLTYKAECRYGVIAGRKGGALLKRGGGGRLIGLSPALEGVVLWDLRTSTRVSWATWLDTPTTYLCTISMGVCEGAYCLGAYCIIRI